MTGHERVTQPSHTENADAGHHTGLEDGARSDVAEFDLAEDGDESTHQEHQTHNGSVTTDDDGLNETHSRGNSGRIEHHEDHAQEEDRHRALRVGLQFLGNRRLGSLHEPLGKAFLVDGVTVEIHVGDKGHHESSEHAGRERRHEPDTEQGGIRPAEGFQDARHVNHGSRHRRRRNGDLGGNHSDGKRHHRTDLLFLSDFNDHGDHGESRVAGTRKDREHIGNDRGEVVDMLGIRTKDTFSNLNEVIETARQLHGGNGGDHGRDDEDHVPGNVTRLHAEAQTQNEHTGAAGVTNAYAPETHTDEDGAQ